MKKLKEKDEVVFSLLEKKVMEKATVKKIKGDCALLSNQVMVCREASKNGVYLRPDGKLGEAEELNERTEKKFLAFQSWFSIKRSLEELSKRFSELDLSNPDKLIAMSKKLSKLIEK